MRTFLRANQLAPVLGGEREAPPARLLPLQQFGEVPAVALLEFIERRSKEPGPNWCSPRVLVRDAQRAPDLVIVDRYGGFWVQHDDWFDLNVDRERAEVVMERIVVMICFRFSLEHTAPSRQTSKVTDEIVASADSLFRQVLMSFAEGSDGRAYLTEGGPCFLV